MIRHRRYPEVDWDRALEWLDAWSKGVAEVNPMTAPERAGYMATLREIRELPELLAREERSPT